MRERTDGEGFATRAIHAGERPDPTTHAHNTPIYATATFAFDTAAEKEDAVDRALEWDPTSYFYSRTGNPTNRALEEKVASPRGRRGLRRIGVRHGGSRGDPVRPPRSGRPRGRRRRAVRDHPGPLGGGPPAARHRRHGRRHDRPGGGRGGDHAPDEGAVHRDVHQPAAAHRGPRRRSPRSRHRHGLLVVADNTFLGPALLRPLEHGADLVLHAATKYLSGHGDAVSGVVSGRQGAARPDPQADGHVRPGGQSVLELPRAARRPDAAAAVPERLRERGGARGVPRGRRRRSSGSATRASRRTRTTRSRRGSSGTGTGRW